MDLDIELRRACAVLRLGEHVLAVVDEDGLVLDHKLLEILENNEKLTKIVDHVTEVVHNINIILKE